MFKFNQLLHKWKFPKSFVLQLREFDLNEGLFGRVKEGEDKWLVDRR